MSLPTSNNGKGSPECDINEKESCSCYNIHIQVAESKSEIDLRIEPDVPHKQSPHPHRTLENVAVGSKSAKHEDPHKVTTFTREKSMDNVHIEYKHPRNSISEGMKEHSQTFSKEKGKRHEPQPRHEDTVSKPYHYSTDDRQKEENQYVQESQEIRQNDHQRPLLRTRTMLYTRREVKNPREAVARLEARQGLFSRSIQQYVIRAVDLCTTPFIRSAELREEKSKSKINPEINPKKSRHKSEARTSSSSVEDNKNNHLSQESEGKYKGQLRDKRFRMHIDDLDYKKVDNSSELIRKSNEIQKKNSGTESRPTELELEIANANKTNEQPEAIISQFNSGKNLSKVTQSNTKNPEICNIPKGKFREKIDTSQYLNKVEDISEVFKDYSGKLDNEQSSNIQIFNDQKVSTKCEKSISFHDTTVIDDEKPPVKRKKRRLEDSPSRPKENLILQENVNKTLIISKDNVKSQRKFAWRKTRSKLSKLHQFTSDTSETDQEHAASFVRDISPDASTTRKQSTHRKKYKHRSMSPRKQDSPHEKIEESYTNYTKNHESKDQLNKDTLNAPVNEETSNSKFPFPNKQENQTNSEITEIFDKNRHSSPSRYHPEKQDKFPVQQHRESTNTNIAFPQTSPSPKKKASDISQNRKKSNEILTVHWFAERNSQQEKSQVVEEGGEIESSSSEKECVNALMHDVFHNQNHHVEQKQDTKISKSKDIETYEDNKTTKHYKESRVQKLKHDTKDPDEITEDTHSKDDLRNPSINMNNRQPNEAMRESLQQKIFGKWQENANEEKQGSHRHSDSFISYKELVPNRRRKKRYSKYKKRVSSQGSCRDMLYSVERGRTPSKSRKKRSSQEPRQESEHQNVKQSPHRKKNAHPDTSRAIPEKTREDSIPRKERSKSKNKEEKRNGRVTRPEIVNVGQENRLLTRTEIADERQLMSSERQFTKPEISNNGQLTRLEMTDKRQLARPEISDNRQFTKVEMPDNRQLTRPEISDNRQLIKLEMPDKRQLTKTEMPDNRQLTKSEITDDKHLTRTEILDNRHLTKPEMTDEMQFSRPEGIVDGKLTRPEIADRRQLTGSETSGHPFEIADERYNTRPEVIVDRQLTRPEIADRRQFTGPETSDHRQLPKSQMADERYNKRLEIQDLRRLTRSKISDKRRLKKNSEKLAKRQLIRPEIVDERPETANERQLTRPEIADEKQLLRSEKANNEQFIKYEMVDDEYCTRSEIVGSTSPEKGDHITERSMLRQDVSFKTKHKKHYITKSKQSRKTSISGSIHQVEKPYREKEFRQVKRAETKILVSVKNNKNTVTANKQPERDHVSASEDKTQNSDVSNTMKGETNEETQEVKGPSTHKGRNKMREKDQTSNTPSQLKESSCQNVPKISENKPERSNQNQNQMPLFSDNIQKTKWEHKSVANTMTTTKRIELNAQGRDKMTRTKNLTPDRCTNSEEKPKMCKRTTDSDRSQRSATVEIKEKDILPFKTPLCKRKSTSTPPKRTDKSETATTTTKTLSSPSDKGKKLTEMEKKDYKDVSKGNIKQKNEQVHKSVRNENTSHREPWRSPGYQPRTSQSYPRRRKERADMSRERKTGTVLIGANYLPKVDESLAEESIQRLQDSFEGGNKIPNKESTNLKERETVAVISPKMHSKQAQKSTQLTKKLPKRLCSNTSTFSRQSSGVNKTKHTIQQHKKCEKEEQQTEKEVRKFNTTRESIQTRTQSRQRNCDTQRLEMNTPRKKSDTPKSSPLLVKRKLVRNGGESSRMTSNHERKKIDPNAGKSPERTKTTEKETLAELNDIPSKMLIITLQDPEGEKQSMQSDLPNETNRSNNSRGEIVFGPKECQDGSSQETENCTNNSKCGTEVMDNSQVTVRESTENTSQEASFFFQQDSLPGEVVEGTHTDNKRLMSERTFIKCSPDNKKIWNGRYEYLNSDNTDSTFGKQPPDNNAPDNKSPRVQRSARENNEENRMCSTDDTEIQSYNTQHKMPDRSRSSNKRLPNKKQSRSRKHEEMHDSYTSNVVERQLSKSDHKNLPVVRSGNKWLSDKQSPQSRTKCLHKTIAVSETDRTFEDSQSQSLDAIQSSINWVSNKTELQNRKSEVINKNFVEIQLSNGDKDYLSSPLKITNWLQNKQSPVCRTPCNKSYTITNVGRQPPNHDEGKHSNELQPSKKHSPCKKPSDAEKNIVKDNNFRKSRYQELLDEIQAEMNQLDILGISHINSIKGRRQVKSIIIPLKQAGDSNDFSSIELPEKRSIILPITDGSMNYLLSRHKSHHTANNPQPQIQVHYVTVAKKRNSSSDTSSSLSSSSEHRVRYRSVSRDRKSPHRRRELDSCIHTSEGSLSNEEECSGPVHAISHRRKTPTEKEKKHRHGSKKTHSCSRETETQDRHVSRSRSARTEVLPSLTRTQYQYERCTPSRSGKNHSTSTRSVFIAAPYPDDPEEDVIRSCFPVQSRHRPKRKAMYDPLAQPNSRRIPRGCSRRSSSTYDDTSSVYKRHSRTTVCSKSSKKSTSSRRSRRSRKHRKHHKRRVQICDNDEDDDEDDDESCSVCGDETEECDECNDKSKSSDSDVPPKRSQRAEYLKYPYRHPSVTLNYCELTYSSDSTQTSQRSPSTERPKLNREPENSRSFGMSTKPTTIHEHGRASVPSRRADQKSRRAIKASNSQDTATSAVASDVAAYGTSSDDYERVRKLKSTKKGGNVYNQYNVQTNVVPSFTSSLYDTLLFNNKYSECKEIFRHPKFLSSSSGKLNDHLSAEELGSFSFKWQDETINQAKLLQMKLKNCLNKNYSEFECPKISQDENKFCKSFSEFSENGRKSVPLRYTKEALESFNRALKALPTMTESMVYDKQDSGVQDNKAIELQVMKDRHQNLTELASSPQIPLQEGIQYRRNKNNNPRQRFTGKEQKGKNSNPIKSTSKLTVNLFPLNAPKSTIVYMAGNVRNGKSSNQKKNDNKTERCKCPKCRKAQMTSQQPDSSTKKTEENVPFMNRQKPNEVEPPVSVLYSRGKSKNTTKPSEHVAVHFDDESLRSQGGKEGEYQVKFQKQSLVELFRNTGGQKSSQISVSAAKVHNTSIRCACRHRSTQCKDHDKFEVYAKLDSSKTKKNMEIEANILSSDSDDSITSLSSKMSFTPSGNLPACSGHCKIPEDISVLLPQLHPDIRFDKLLAIEYEPKVDEDTAYGQVKELNDILEKDSGKEKCEDIFQCEEKGCHEEEIKIAENQKHSCHSEDVLMEHSPEEDIKAISSPTHSYHSEDVLREHTPEEDIKAISSPTHSYHSEDALMEHTPEEDIKAISSPTHSYHSENILMEHTPEEDIKAISSPTHSYHSEDVLREHTPDISRGASTSQTHSYHSENILMEHTPEEDIKAISSQTHSYHSENILMEHTPKEDIKAISSPTHSYHSEDVLREHTPDISRGASISQTHSYHSENILMEHTRKEDIKAISSPTHSYLSENILMEHTRKEDIKAISSPTHSYHSEDVLMEHTPDISRGASTSQTHSYHSENILMEHTPKEDIKAISSPTHSCQSEVVLMEHTPEEDIKAISSPKHSYPSENVLMEHTPEEDIKYISSPTHSYYSEDVLMEHTTEEDMHFFSSPTNSYYAENVLMEHTTEEDIHFFSSPTNSYYAENVLMEHTPKEYIKAISQDPSTPPVYYNPSSFECLHKKFRDVSNRDFHSQTSFNDSLINEDEDARNDSEKAFISTYTVEDIAPPKQKALLARREIILESYLLAIQVAHIQLVILPSPEVYYDRSPSLFVEEGGENSLMVDAKPFQGKCDCIWCPESEKENKDCGECSLQSCMVNELTLPVVPQDTTISLLSIVTSSMETIPAIQSPQNTKSLLLQKMYNSPVSVKESSQKNSVPQQGQSTDNEIIDTSSKEENQFPNSHPPSSYNKSSGTSGCLSCMKKKKSQTSIEDTDIPDNSVPQNKPSTTEKFTGNVFSTSSHDIHPLLTSQSVILSSYNKTAKRTGHFPSKTKRKSQVNIKDTDLPDDSTSQSSAQDRKDRSILETPQLPPDRTTSSRSRSSSHPSDKRHSSGCSTIIRSPEGDLILHFCPKDSDGTIQLTPDTSDLQMDDKTLKRGVFEIVSLEEEMPFVSEMPNNSKEKTQPSEQQDKQHNFSTNKCQTGNRDEWHFCPLYPESYSAVSSDELLMTTAEEVPKSWSEVSNISSSLEDEGIIMEDISRSRVQVYHIIPDDIKNVFQLRNSLLHQVTDFSNNNNELTFSYDLDKNISEGVKTVERITQGSESVCSVVPDISKAHYSIDNQGKNKEDKPDILCLSEERKPSVERNSNLNPLASVNSDHSPEVTLNTVPNKNDPSFRVTQKRDSFEGKQNNLIETPTESNLKSEIILDFDNRDADSSSNKLKDGNHVVKNSAEEEIQSLSNFLEELEVWQSQVSSEISLYFKLLNKDPPSTSIEQLAGTSKTAERVKRAHIKEKGESSQQPSTANGQSITTRNEGFSNLLSFSRPDKSINCVINPQINSLPELPTTSQKFQNLSSSERFSNFSSFSRPGESTDCTTNTQINSFPELITTSQEFQKPSSLVGYEDGIQHERDQNTKEEAGYSAYYPNSVPLVYSSKQEYVIANGFETATSPERASVSPPTEDIIHAHEGVIQPINPGNLKTTPQLGHVNNTFSQKENNMKIVGKSIHNVSDKKTDKTENHLEMHFSSNKGSESKNRYECSFENRENEYSQNTPELDDLLIFQSSENVELIDVALGSSLDNVTKVEVHSTTQKKELLFPEGKSLDLLVTINGSSEPQTQLFHKNIFKYDSSVTSTSTDEELGTPKPEISSSFLVDDWETTGKDYSFKSPMKNEKGTTREKFVKEVEDTSSKTDDISNRVIKNYENFHLDLDPLTIGKRTNEQLRNETKNMRQNKEYCSFGSDDELLTLSINTNQEVTFSIDLIESDLSTPLIKKDVSPIHFNVPNQESGESIDQPDFKQITDFSKSNNEESTDYIQILENMYTIPNDINTEFSVGNSKTISVNKHHNSNTAQAATSIQEDFVQDTTHKSTRREIQAAALPANMKRSRKKLGLDKDLEAANNLLPQTEREQVKNSHAVAKSKNSKKKVHTQESSKVTPNRKKEDAVLSVKKLDHLKYTLEPVTKKSSSSKRNVPDSERERDDLSIPKEVKLKKKVFFGLLGGWTQHQKIDKASGSGHDVPQRLHIANSRGPTNSRSSGVTKNCEESKKDHTSESSTSEQQASRMFWPSCVKKIVQVQKKTKIQGSKDSR